MNPTDPREVVDRHLGQLPALRAPETLLPRVLAAVQAWTLRPWYERAWRTWPRGWQVASVAVLMALTAGGLVLLPVVHSVAHGAVSTMSAAIAGDLPIGVQRLDAALNAVLVLWRALIAPVVTYASCLMLLMYVASATFAVALGRVASGRAFPL